MDKDKVKSALYKWIKGNEGMSVSRILILMEKRKVCTADELGLLTLDDMFEVKKQADDDKMLGERFELLTSLINEINTTFSAYEDGLLSMPGLVTQIDYKVYLFIREHERYGNCINCSTDNVLGIMEFVCNECRKMLE